MYKYIIYLLLLSVTAGMAAAAGVFETGALQDTQGFEDGQGARVFMATNLMGSRDRETGNIVWKQRYLAVEVPLNAASIEQVSAVDLAGEPLEQLVPAEITPGIFDREGQSLVKLYFPGPEGFGFRLVLSLRDQQE